MQNKNYLLAVEFGMNGDSAVADRTMVEFLEGEIHYWDAGNRIGRHTVNAINGGVVRIRYNQGFVASRNFGLYGLTDGQGFIADMTSRGDSVMIEESGVDPYEPLARAHMLMTPDGRLYVDESLSMRGASTKPALRRVKQLAPELYSEFVKNLF